MVKLGEQREDECFILVKAQPHRSSKYYETVCCAGVGRDGVWRRQYPVPFRILQEPQRFKRWSWISYSYNRSEKDKRKESQKVVPETISVSDEVPRAERAKLLNPLLRASFSEAEANQESLALLRPKAIEFTYRRLPDDQIAQEREKHAALAKQASFFDETAKPLNPCPYEFKVDWVDQEDKRRSHVCDDWESVGAFFNFRRRFQDEHRALETLKEKYEVEYFQKGLALAFSTHSRRGQQWLLVGLIRLDEDLQSDLFWAR